MKHDKTYASLEAGDDVYTIGLNRAVTLIAEKVAKGPGRGRFQKDPGKPLGDHPSGGAITVKNGRYGPYVSHEGTNATLPSDITPETVTLAQAIEFPGSEMKSRVWIDADQAVHKMTMPLMGVELVLLACDEACAKAPNQGTDVFERTLATAPRALAASELDGTLRHTLAVRGDGRPLALPETDEQQVRREGDRWLVTIQRTAGANRQPPPRDADLQPNDWLQSTAPELVSLARRATAGAETPKQRMQRIEAFVRDYIRTKSLDVGYASALEVARTPEGDCTEHAVLVAALGRAAGIPTRVVDGLAYAPGFAGRDQVFVPHAWTQAWVDGRWQSFDAALDGFDAGHIALAIGDGDPWQFYAGLDMLGRIRIDRSDALPLGGRR